MTNQELLTELPNRFPGINDPDEEMDGGDTVDALCQWYHEIIREVGNSVGVPTDEEAEMERGRR